MRVPTPLVFIRESSNSIYFMHYPAFPVVIKAAVRINRLHFMHDRSTSSLLNRRPVPPCSGTASAKPPDIALISARIDALSADR